MAVPRRAGLSAALLNIFFNAWGDGIACAFIIFVDNMELGEVAGFGGKGED